MFPSAQRYTSRLQTGEKKLKRMIQIFACRLYSIITATHD